MSETNHEIAAAPQPPLSQVRGDAVVVCSTLAGTVILVYLAVAYVIMPLTWKRDVRRHPDLFDAPRITHTPAGIPGDPVNVALLGSESDVIHAMTKAKWDPADDLTFRSSVRISVDSVFRRPDPNAPVSTLELFGRKQDLAFEQPVGNSPRQRHHVRFWHWDRLHEGREVWFGAITFDERVGLSHTTAQVTHHIGPDLDAERDRLFGELQQAGVTQECILVETDFNSCRERMAAAIRGTRMDGWKLPCSRRHQLRPPLRPIIRLGPSLMVSSAKSSLSQRYEHRDRAVPDRLWIARSLFIATTRQTKNR